MNKRKQKVKLCGICESERAYNDYHRLYNPCKICVAKNLVRYYKANRDKRFAKSKLYQQNTKKVRKSHSQ